MAPESIGSVGHLLEKKHILKLKTWYIILSHLDLFRLSELVHIILDLYLLPLKTRWIEIVSGISPRRFSFVYITAWLFITHLALFTVHNIKTFSNDILLSIF